LGVVYNVKTHFRYSQCKHFS